MSELIQNFGIDWRLLLAQVVNFTILLFILKKFAYVPILNALKERKEGIEKGILMRKQVQEELLHVEELKAEALREANKKAFSLIAKAEEEASRRKDEIIKKASRKGEVILADAKESIEEEKSKMGEQFYGQAHELIRLGIERVLAKIPQKERDGELIKEALHELRAIKE